MSLRDQVAKFFAKPKPDVPEALNTAAGELDQLAARNEKAERERATAIDAKQAELLRTRLTPELTPFGTQPQRPPTGDEARALAEKHVAVKDGAARDGKDRPPQIDREAERAKVEANKDPAKAKGKDGADDSDHLKPEEVTPAYVETVIALQAAHEVEADEARNPASWTKEERAAKVAEQVAIIEAEQASAALTHTTGGGRTL